MDEAKRKRDKIYNCRLYLSKYLRFKSAIFASQEIFMKKYIVLLFAAAISFSSFAQTKTSKNRFDLTARPSDHLMLQLSSDRWMGAPDSLDSHQKGISRGANVYIMLDKSFKSNPHFSVAFGLGIGTSHLFLNKMSVDITGSTPILGFNNLDANPKYSKYKVSTTYLELPVELRYFSNPEKINKSLKIALGLKVGVLLNAHTKGKSGYTEKLSSKSYFNSNRLVGTARIGYGYVSLFGAYNLTSIFKDKVAEDMKLFQIGIAISGL